MKKTINNYRKGILTNISNNSTAISQLNNSISLKVEQTDSSNELTRMEAQLAKLKELWKQADTVRKKDKIHKQIKEVQKQIDKLNKDLNAGT